MCSIHNLLLHCIVLFHLAPQLTIWSALTTGHHRSSCLAGRFERDQRRNFDNQNDNNFESINHFDATFDESAACSPHRQLIHHDHRLNYLNHHPHPSSPSSDRPTAFHLSQQFKSTQLGASQSKSQPDHSHLRSSSALRSSDMNPNCKSCVHRKSSGLKSDLNIVDSSAVFGHRWSSESTLPKSILIDRLSFLFNLHVLRSLLAYSVQALIGDHRAKTTYSSRHWWTAAVGVQAIVSDVRGHRTLRMFQTHACEGDYLKLNCPKNSAISIYSAHFGGLRAVQEPATLCPDHMDKFNALNDHRTDGDDDQRLNSSLRCSSVQAFRIVDSRCRDNRTCVLQASVIEFLTQPNLTLITEQEAKKFKQSTEIMIDLCSSDVTYGEVMYKCKPTSILSKGICENENLHLNCPKKQVIHIYKAFYGPINELYTAQCKSTSSPRLDNRNDNKKIAGLKNDILSDDDDECPVTNETEMLIELCQGYRKCNLIASDDTFYKNQTDALVYHSNCRKRKRLKVHYTCTNAKILTDEYQNRFQASDSLESLSSSSSTQSTPVAADDPFASSSEDSAASGEQVVSTEQPISTSSHVPNHFNILDPRAAKEPSNRGVLSDVEPDEDANCTTSRTGRTALGFVSEWIQAVYYISGNLERLLLYFLVSILFSLLCTVIVMSCKLRKDKNRVKKCIKQNQLPIFEYTPKEDEDNQLMSPTLTTQQHYKQLQRQLGQNALLLNQPPETNNNSLQPSRNRAVMLSLAAAAPGGHQPSTTFYGGSQHQAMRSSPTSQINPNYIHPFLNERELINRDDDDDDDEPIEGGFVSPEFGEPSLNTERTSLMVPSMSPIRSSFKAQNLAQLTNHRPKRPILDHASTIHFIRTSAPPSGAAAKPTTLIVKTNRTALSSSTLSALLSGGRAATNQFTSKTFFTTNDTNDERRLLSSSPNLHPMHALTTATPTTPTSSPNTTLTSTNPNSSSSPSQSFSQRTTPQSKVRLRNFDQSNEGQVNDERSNGDRRQSPPQLHSLTASLTKSSAIVTTITPQSPPASSQSSGTSKSNASSPISIPSSPPPLPLLTNRTAQTVDDRRPTDVAASETEPKTKIKPTETKIDIESDIKRPAWVGEPSPVKQNVALLTSRSFDETYKKKATGQSISSVGENLFSE